ncbi:MAG: hypothetical protein CFK49_05315 [Armatimonadetes bacterium JP3_11]|jgi:hypothetical protein|nr:MAG: hypothetical protein CFK48_03565 [Armatimonadetes bacterium CP1_7O]OYT75035.1 MAG: hypothetical protein CFK49_05315 [Armatimonadetes bacterium JP3_11]RMH07625.1 MAG: hypothetical protein D6697_08090 [Armatimonadota bacterium]
MPRRLQGKDTLSGLISLCGHHIYFALLLEPYRRLKTQEVLLELRQAVEIRTAKLIGVGMLTVFLTLLLPSGRAMWRKRDQWLRERF